MEMEKITVAKSWAKRGFGCSTWSDPPGQVWVNYVHHADELLMLVDGEIEVRINNTVLRPAIGEEIFIPSGTRHTVSNIGQQTNRWLYGYRR